MKVTFGKVTSQKPIFQAQKNFLDNNRNVLSHNNIKASAQLHDMKQYPGGVQGK